MNPRLLPALLALLLSTIAAPAMATTLVEAVVPVASATQAERDQALRAALAQVLEQEFTVPADLVPPSLRDRAATYAVRFGVENAPDAVGALQFRAAFDREALARELRAQGLLAPVERVQSDLRVPGVTSIEEYGRVLTALRNARGLSQVDVLGIDGDTLSLRLQYDASQTSIDRLMAEAGIAPAFDRYERHDGQY